MTIKVHIRILGLVEAEYVGVDLSEVNPDFLSILPFIDIFVIILIKSDLSPVHIEGDDTSALTDRLLTFKANTLLTPLWSIITRVISDISAPVDALPLGIFVILFLVLLLLVCIEQRLRHDVLIVTLCSLCILFVFILVVMLRQQDVQAG